MATRDRVILPYYAILIGSHTYISQLSDTKTLIVASSTAMTDSAVHSHNLRFLLMQVAAIDKIRVNNTKIMTPESDAHMLLPAATLPTGRAATQRHHSPRWPGGGWLEPRTALPVETLRRRVDPFGYHSARRPGSRYIDRPSLLLNVDAAGQNARTRMSRCYRTQRSRSAKAKSTHIERS